MKHRLDDTFMNMTGTAKKSKYVIMAFLLGLLSANNVAYAFVVGTTPILLIYLYALLCLAWLLWVKKARIDMALSMIPQSLWLFLACTFLSLFWVLTLNSDYVYQWMVGMVSLGLNCAVVFLVVALKDYRKSILQGVMVGIICNAILVLYAFILYQQGEMFSLTEVFPAWEMPIQLMHNTFRGWGLFIEPGHLMRYVAIMALAVYAGLNKSNRIINTIFVFSVLLIMTFTISSAMAVFVVGVFLFILLSGRASVAKVFLSLGAIALLFLGLYGFSKISYVGAEIWRFFIAGLFDFSDSAGNSVIRMSGMKNAFSIIKNYLVIGCGWNIFTKIFQEAGYYVNDVRGAYSELLSIIAELGVGALTYIVFIFSSIKNNLKKKNASYIAMGCATMIYFALFTMTDYSINGDCAVFIGLIIASQTNESENDMGL